MHHIIGTAGHIDHGKTSLVRALTGQNTDRLAEERRRGISIDLGFAHLDLRDGSRAGIIDVPGHQRFIRNMVAGVHGMDLVLFCVAADDGVMPQTEEHFDILQMLGVEKVIFAITKADLVAPSRVAEVQEEIAILVAGTPLKEEPVVLCSCISGEGLPELREQIYHTIAHVRKDRPRGHFRLPIDRVFSVKGYGLVVTGTAVAGDVSTNSEICICPGNEKFRVRGIQVHNQAVENAGWGQRVAINIVGNRKLSIRRGDVVCDPRISRTSDRFDVDLSLGTLTEKGLKSFQRIRFHSGTAERLGKVIILGGETRMAKNTKGFCQIVVDGHLHVMRGDAFVIRDESAQRTLGGGRVVDPLAARHPASKINIAARLKNLRDGNDEQIAITHIDGASAFALTVSDIAFLLNMRESEALQKALRFREIRKIAVGKSVLYSTESRLSNLLDRILNTVQAFHQGNPLEMGISIDRLKAKAARGMELRVFKAIVEELVSRKSVVWSEGVISLPNHRVKLDNDHREAAEYIVLALQKAPLMPPDLSDLLVSAGLLPATGESLVRLLERRGKIVLVRPDMAFSRGVVDKVHSELVSYLAEHGQVTAAGFRDLLGVTRKYAIALLEYFDGIGVTHRVGDVRKKRDDLSSS